MAGDAGPLPGQLMAAARFIALNTRSTASLTSMASPLTSNTASMELISSAVEHLLAAHRHPLRDPNVTTWEDWPSYAPISEATGHPDSLLKPRARVKIESGSWPLHSFKRTEPSRCPLPMFAKTAASGEHIWASFSSASPLLADAEFHDRGLVRAIIKLQKGQRKADEVVLLPSVLSTGRVLPEEQGNHLLCGGLA